MRIRGEAKGREGDGGCYNGSLVLADREIVICTSTDIVHIAYLVYHGVCLQKAVLMLFFTISDSEMILIRSKFQSLENRLLRSFEKKNGSVRIACLLL